MLRGSFPWRSLDCRWERAPGDRVGAEQNTVPPRLGAAETAWLMEAFAGMALAGAVGDSFTRRKGNISDTQGSCLEE